MGQMWVYEDVMKVNASVFRIRKKETENRKAGSFTEGSLTSLDSGK